MSRLPTPGQDEGQWGDILNDFLAQVHNTDGTIKDNAIGIEALNVGTPASNQVLSYSGSGLTWATPSSAPVPDADATTKGVVQLAGDLGGTSALPTVPGLAGKANAADLTSHTSNTSNPHAVTKAQVGLGNVDNTSDANKPVSTATQSALNLKANLASPTFTGTVTVPTPSNNNDAANKGYVDSVAGAGAPDASSSTKGIVRLTGDLGGTADSPTVPGLAGKANTSHTHAAGDITSGTVATARLGSGTANSSTYLRGDGTWATPSGGGGGGGLTAVAQNTDYTANAGEVIIADAASSGFTVTLPAPSNGAQVSIKKIDSSVNGILVVPPSGLIDNLSSLVVNNQWQSYDLFSDGTKWYRI